MVREAWVEAVQEALSLLEGMSVFYYKYHLLTFEERVLMEHELKETHESFVGSKVLVQQHIDILKWRMEEMREHFEAWIADEMVARKVWKTHPRREFEYFLSKTAAITAKMEDVLVRQHRVIEGSPEPRRHSSVSWGSPLEHAEANSQNLSGGSILREKK